jgi:hypothetical protein
MTALDRAQCGKHLGDPRVRVLLESAAKRHRLLNRNSRKEPPPA